MSKEVIKFERLKGCNTSKNTFQKQHHHQGTFRKKDFTLEETVACLFFVQCTTALYPPNILQQYLYKIQCSFENVHEIRQNVRDKAKYSLFTLHYESLNSKTGSQFVQPSSLRLISPPPYSPKSPFPQKAHNVYIAKALQSPVRANSKLAGILQNSQPNRAQQSGGKTSSSWRERQIGRQIDIQMDHQIYNQIDRYIYIQIYRQRDRQKDRRYASYP